DVAGRRPALEPPVEDEVRHAVDEHEGAVGKLVERELPASRVEPLSVQPGVDRVRSDLAGVELPPERDQPVVVLSSAERAGTVPGRERGRVIEEEELGESSRLEQRLSAPAAEFAPTGDLALGGVAAPEPSDLVLDAT